MERRRAGSPSYSRQQSVGSAPSSPVMSPVRRSSSTLGAVKKAQNLAAKAASARLARAMVSQSGGSDDDLDDEDDGYLPTAAAAGARSQYGERNGGAAVVGRFARSPSPLLGRKVVEHAPAVRSTSAGRPSAFPPTVLVPPIRTSLRIPTTIPAIEPSIDSWKDKRFSADMEHLNSRRTGSMREVSALQDELDMLQEENEIVLEKLLLAEERCEEAEARAKEFEKQVAALGQGASLESGFLIRKEAAIREREIALRAATQANDGRYEEVTTLREKVKSARNEVNIAVEQLKEAESETKSLRTMTQRMILTQEEMEEVVLKRCWLARYWGLAVRHGIYPEIAVSKHEYWSSLAPLPLEVVISAGQKAKEESWKQGNDDLERRRKLVRGLSDITVEGNIEGLLSVEKGLRELASLKIEDAVMLSMDHHRRSNLFRQTTSDIKSPVGSKFIDAFELSQEESEDVLFKQAWLTYFWRRAITHGVEDGFAEERLRFWIGRSGHPPASQDAVDVERGMIELRKLGIEQQLWEASRREIEQDPDQNLHADYA